MNRVRAGEQKAARKMFSALKDRVAGNGGNPADYPIFLEVWYLLERDPQARVRISEDLVRLSPKNPVFYNYMGVANYRAGDRELAGECFDHDDIVLGLVAARMLGRRCREEHPERGLDPADPVRGCGEQFRVGETAGQKIGETRGEGMVAEGSTV